MKDRRQAAQAFAPKHPLDSLTLKLAFWGAVLAVLAYIGPVFAAGETPDWRVCVGIFCGGLVSALGAAIGRRRGGGPISLHVSRRKRKPPGGGGGGAVVAGLLVATLMAPSCGTLHLRPATTSKILHTVGAIGSILADWCDPEVYDLDAEICDTVLTYYTVGEAGAAIVLPHYTEPEFGSDDNQQAESARIGIVSCMKVLAVCSQVDDGPTARPKARVPIGAHRQVCEQVKAACAADGIAVEFSPASGGTTD